jgi:transposase
MGARDNSVVGGPELACRLLILIQLAVADNFETLLAIFEGASHADDEQFVVLFEHQVRSGWFSYFTRQSRKVAVVFSHSKIALWRSCIVLAYRMQWLMTCGRVSLA